jgi:hypothetical protein
MRPHLIPLRHPSRSRAFILLLTFAVTLSGAFATGCGSGSSNSTPPLSGNTSVTVLFSSTANSQLSEFNIGFNTITLTSQSGKIVTLFNGVQNQEFVHLNGGVETLATVSIPQDMYTSATETVGDPLFVCVSLDPSGGLDTSTFEVIGDLAPITQTFATPITVTGTSMGLLWNLQVTQSASYSNCEGGGTFSITPTFNVAPLAILSAPTNVENGKENDINGQITSVNESGNGFTLITTGGSVLAVNTNASTVFQGIAGLSALVPEMAVDMDAAIQSDGSLLATRVAVEDADTTTVSVLRGPLMFVAGSLPVGTTLGRQEQGYLFTTEEILGGFPFSFGDATFQISGQLTNLQNLPFVPSFNSANMFDGQNVYITSHATAISGGPTYLPATTVTLMPQTINGTISAISSDGGFTTYTVALPSYDLISALAVQAGQPTVLIDPGDVIVYVDSNTEMLNMQPLAVGNVLRFNGMLFNDNGTARMDCAQVNDGVALLPGSDSYANGRSVEQTARGIIVRGAYRTPLFSK